MNRHQRIDLLVDLGSFLQSNAPEWAAARNKAFLENNWFTLTYIATALENIVSRFLQREVLQDLADRYALPDTNLAPKKVGIIMAGNIPLVGFHDLLCVFLTGHYAYIKPSSKDAALIQAIVNHIHQQWPQAVPYFTLAERLNNCDAYIATGSNNSGRYFEQYFGKYPHIIRRNRTSVAVLDGTETTAELEALSDDVHQYFGLGCRNVTHLYVPKEYDFVPLLAAFDRYADHINHHKYKNNYDYNLAIHLLNHKYYMTNGTTLLIEDESLFAPISQVNYSYYTDKNALAEDLRQHDAVQCIVGGGGVPFGQAQCPAVDSFADGTDTLAFLKGL